MLSNLASYIDHTLLNPDATKADIDLLISEAKQYEFATVCVNPYWVPYCSKELKDTSVEVCTVIGFPLGASTTETKVFEANLAVEKGATEIDMVINIGELKDKNDSVVLHDISSVVKQLTDRALLKVIIETSLLTEEEKVRACKLAKRAGADFVKTSTGFSGSGATVEDVQLMNDTVGLDLGIKASGGIRDLDTTKKMIKSGATRIGASSGVNILMEKKAY